MYSILYDTPYNKKIASKILRSTIKDMGTKYLSNFMEPTPIVHKARKSKDRKNVIPFKDL